MKPALLVQTAALLMAAVAVLWNLALFLWIFYPAGSGEWLRLARPASLAGAFLSLVALLISLVARNGSSLLRRLVIIVSPAALTLAAVIHILTR